MVCRILYSAADNGAIVSVSVAQSSSCLMKLAWPFVRKQYMRYVRVRSICLSWPVLWPAVSCAQHPVGPHWILQWPPQPTLQDEPERVGGRLSSRKYGNTQPPGIHCLCALTDICLNNFALSFWSTPSGMRTWAVGALGDEGRRFGLALDFSHRTQQIIAKATGNSNTAPQAKPTSTAFVVGLLCQ